MMKEINYLSAIEFKRLMKSYGFPTYFYNRNVISRDCIETFDWAVISIGNTENIECDNDIDLWANGPNNHWLPDCDNVLNINFNDVDNSDGKYQGAFNELHAQEILYFLEDNKDKNRFIIHCSAGISRSGAIASIAYDYFKSLGYDVKIAPEYPKTPNIFIRSLLNKVIRNY